MTRFRNLAIAGLGLLMTGCGEELGPVPMRVVRVRGTIREGQRPLAGGWIEFFPVNGTVGNLRSARLRSDGSFEAYDVAAGENLIRLVNTRHELPGASRIFGAYSSPIRRVISDSQTSPIDVDLVQEMIRHQGMQERLKRAESRGTRVPQ